MNVDMDDYWTGKLSRKICKHQHCHVEFV
jgi:hypothetical protein